MATTACALGPSCNSKGQTTRSVYYNTNLTLLWAAPLLCLLLLGGASAQGLIPVPATVTRELGAYYISKFGLTDADFDFYSVLTQRNIGNVYAQINNLSATDTPQAAARKSSTVRGLHSANTLGGRVTVESFYRLLRCEDDSCFVTSRVVVAEVDSAVNGPPQYAMATVRSKLGGTHWTLNAPQSVASNLLDTQEEESYKDPVYRGFTLYHKVTRPPPCSSALPMTHGGALQELRGKPGFQCVNSDGLTLIVGARGIQGIPLPWDQCKGDLFLLYVTSSLDVGPSVYRVITNPGNVPFTVTLFLPPNSQDCNFLYAGGPAKIVAAARALMNHDFRPDTYPNFDVLPEILALGFNNSRAQCAPYFRGTYGQFVSGQATPPTEVGLVDPYLPYNVSSLATCVAMLGEDTPDTSFSRIAENACAQLFLGKGGDQLREAIITQGGDSPDTQTSDTTYLEYTCGESSYSLGISLILPQIAADFEAEKNFVLLSSEVKYHLDAVATNAASVLAVEAAVATSGIIIARTIARSGLYRRRRVASNLARGVAMAGSLSNHGDKAVFTQVSVHNYRPGNFSTVLRAETYTFVTVQGSRATAVIGLVLYSATMLLCLYLTWTEFTEIIHRREAAESRFGQDALIADKDLLIQWRAADSLMYDTLHPTKVVELAQAQELEIMRRNFALAANPRLPSRGVDEFSPRGGVNEQSFRGRVNEYSPLRSPRPQPQERSARDLYPEQRKDSVPDLYL
ncbi:hypothetical protein KFL_000040510 [Klebsormidium nitens]|uniref:Transmembrane protein n=1 Tax=Klebsormidium nitens TaxID=105231 RepID=A0A1Y1HLK2_KLENI|nr:hypothetical protein KFL_000040510 [Klebsormidium nitens]|eukprot:GAQ77851.1 hypothetical protein KFL_000040510 [Klebsormidium nitens]